MLGGNILDEIRPARLRADFALLDAEDRPVGVGAVEGRPRSLERLEARLSRYLDAAPAGVEYGLLATLEVIRLYRRDENGGAPMLLFEAPTVETLRPYDPTLAGRRIMDFYLVTLVEAWLRDHAYHWKMAHPPYGKELGEAGLLPLLKDGSTAGEYVLVP